MTAPDVTTSPDRNDRADRHERVDISEEIQNARVWAAVLQQHVVPLRYVPLATTRSNSVCSHCPPHKSCQHVTVYDEHAGRVPKGFVMHSSRGGARGLRERLLEAAPPDVVEVVIPTLLRRYQL
jgi:hypothetical protein